jgi:hypothetical protein
VADDDEDTHVGHEDACMGTFILFTRLLGGTSRSGETIEDLERNVVEHVREACPNVRWISSHAVLGRVDYVDFFQAPDIETAMKVSALVRTHGRADTEVWPALSGIASARWSGL